MSFVLNNTGRANYAFTQKDTSIAIAVMKFSIIHKEAVFR